MEIKIVKVESGISQPEILPHGTEIESHSAPAVAENYNNNADDRIKSRSQPFRCTLCPSAYATKNNLTKHMTNIHEQQSSAPPNEPKESFQCNLCPKKFVHPGSLKKHITNAHVDDAEKPFQCQVCLTTSNKCKKFIDEKSLNNHMKKIHGPPKFECETCMKKFNSSSNLARHRLSHSGTKRFKCDICSSLFSDKNGLNCHLLRKHNKEDHGFKVYNCELCEMKFSSRHALENHVIKAHVVDKPFECEVCSQTFIDEKQLSSHSKKHQSVEKSVQHVCDVCSAVFKFKKTLICHLQKKHSRSSYCMKCFRSFETKLEFDDHSKIILDGEADSNLECLVCSLTFNTQCLFSLHTESHLKELHLSTKIVQTELSSKQQLNTGSFQCDLCSKSFSRSFNLATHRKHHHPDAKWQCKTCLKVFKYRYNLKNHEETHSTERTYSCKVCQKSFKTSMCLKGHEQLHLEEKRYKCQFCSKSFSNSTRLKLHNANYHGGEKPFKCHLCLQCWATNGQLKRHLISHTTEKLVKCDLCPKFFKSAKSAQAHKRKVHEKHLSKTRLRNQITVRPYPCKICEKSFTTSLRLKYHERTHLAETLYKCENCPKSFSRSWKLKVHLTNSHGGEKEKPFKCYLCSKSFSCRSQLKLHLTVHFNEKTVKCDLCPKYFKHVWHMQSHQRKVHQKLKYRNRFLCKLCSFESTDNKDIATHYSKHSLPVVVLSKIVFSTNLENALNVSSVKNEIENNN